MQQFESQDFYKINLENSFLGLVSLFRSSLDQMNTCFIDLIQYHENLLEDCVNISNINKETIKEFISSQDELYHYNSVSIIYKYLNTSQTINLLNKINKEIQNKFEEFLKDPASPYNGLNLKNPISIEKLKKKLNNYKNKIDDPKSETEPFLYMDDFYSIFLDDNQTDEVERRYYGEPYHVIPCFARKSINRFINYVNLLFLLRTILNFDDNICELCEKFEIPVVSVL